MQIIYDLNFTYYYLQIIFKPALHRFNFIVKVSPGILNINF